MKFTVLLFILTTVYGFTNNSNETDGSRPGWKDMELIGGELEEPGNLPAGDSRTEPIPMEGYAEQPKRLILSGLDGLPYLLENAHSTPELSELMSKGWGFAVNFYVENGVFRIPTGLVEDLAEIGVMVDFGKSTAEIQSEIEEEARRVKMGRELESQRDEEEEQSKEETEERETGEDKDGDQVKDKPDEDNNENDGDEEDGIDSSDGKDNPTEKNSDPDKTEEEQATEPAKQSLNGGLNQPDPKEGPRLYQVIGGNLVPVSNPKTMPRENTYSPDANGIWWDSYVRLRENPLPEAQIVLPNSVNGSQISKPGSSPFPKHRVQKRATSVEDTLVDWKE